ncbi:hypothetical protein SAMN05443667_102351 [Flavobacterium gillisiae]|uniref:Uncharacterized protein n=1 Tax=Flavobacterium gillisiae TaxID=150146 RepID=A0A1H3ZCT1_9FLAO|nr:hypothetical protein SAMN05443667_102351 [Flavobacterium gillisiae]
MGWETTFFEFGKMKKESNKKPSGRMAFELVEVITVFLGFGNRPFRGFAPF